MRTELPLDAVEMALWRQRIKKDSGLSPKISEVLPLLYLHGLSSGDFVPALEQFLGSSVGLSPATVTRLTVQWQADHRAFMDRDLSATDYVYI